MYAPKWADRYYVIHCGSDRQRFQLLVHVHAGAPISVVESPAVEIIRVGDGSTESMPELERRLLADSRIQTKTLRQKLRDC